MYSNIQERLQELVRKRNYYFQYTSREDAKKYLDKRRVFNGMAAAEVAQLEAELSYTFPDDFRQYLQVFGENCGELFCLGQDLEPHKFVQYQEWGKELLEDNGIDNFWSGDTRVFEFHQGYAFSCFHKDSANQLSIYQYVEGEERPMKRFDHFGQMLEAEVKKLEILHEQVKDSDGHFVIIRDGYVQLNYPARNKGIVPRLVGDIFLD